MSNRSLLLTTLPIVHFAKPNTLNSIASSSLQHAK